MITLSQNISDLLEKDTIDIFYMLQIEDFYLQESDKRLLTTTFYSDITLSDNRTFKSDGILVSISPPKLESIVDKSTFEIIFADPNFELLGTLESTLIGNSVEIRAGFLDTLTNIPLTNIVDTLLIYKGKIDNFSYKVNTEELGESLLIITCGSPMFNLDHRRQYFLNKDYVRSQFPEDSCCDQISEGSATLAVKWGKT